MLLRYIFRSSRKWDLFLVCEIPRRFERSSPSDFRTQGSFIHINSRKFSYATFFRQIALQNLQRKNLGFSETVLYSYSLRTSSVREDFHIEVHCVVTKWSLTSTLHLGRTLVEVQGRSLQELENCVFLEIWKDYLLTYYYPYVIYQIEDSVERGC